MLEHEYIWIYENKSASGQYINQERLVKRLMRNERNDNPASHGHFLSAFVRHPSIRLEFELNEQFDWDPTIASTSSNMYYKDYMELEYTIVWGM